MTDLDDLEAKARAATPGPWDNHSINGEPIESVWLADGSVVATWAIKEPRFEFHAPQARADAAFIAAANPAAVLELVQRLRAAEAIVRDLAACDPRDPEFWKCQLCKAQYVVEYPDDDEPKFKATHAESCPYRRAVEATKP
jgi:hypothetical protein